MFGFLPYTGVDFTSYSGSIAGSKYGVSVYVLNQRMATVLTSVASIVNNLCPGVNKSENAFVQLAVQTAVLEVLVPTANTTDRRAALSSATTIAAVVDLAFKKLQSPQADLQTCATLTTAQRSALFGVLAKVRKGRTVSCTCQA